jgi:hypothetical protein
LTDGFALTGMKAEDVHCRFDKEYPDRDNYSSLEHSFNCMSCERRGSGKRYLLTK